MSEQKIKETVKEKYAEAALKVLGGGTCGCDPVSENLYEASETAGLPEGAVLASLGCGNPTALADLHEGETVLDLGSGGGIDVLLSAKRVGPTGKAYGLDMTDEMLALARENQAKAGVANVEFLKGEIENIPLPAGAVDVIISNCVINLSADKGRVLKEAFRVLRSGGRIYIDSIDLESDAGWASFVNDGKKYQGFARTPYVLRPSTAAELMAYVKRAGFTQVQSHRRPPLIVVTAVKPA